LQEAKTEEEWKSASSRLITYIKDPRPPEVAVAGAKLTALGDWAEAMSILAPRLGASGSCDEALAILGVSVPKT
jgi:hypothetical protein